MSTPKIPPNNVTEATPDIVSILIPSPPKSGMNDSAERISEAGLAVDFSDYADNSGFIDIINVGSISIVENEAPRGILTADATPSVAIKPVLLSVVAWGWLGTFNSSHFIPAIGA
jgi:hypothetical protein